MKKLFTKIHTSFVLAIVFGLYNFSYNKETSKFKTNTFLSLYSRCARIVSTFAISVTILAFIVLKFPLMNYMGTDEKANSQQAVLWYLNAIQQWVTILTAYHNHSSNQFKLLNVLNTIAKCDSSLKKLLKASPPTVKKYNKYATLRLVTTAMDIYFTYTQPSLYNNAICEYKCVFAISKLILTALFLEWHFIQTQMTTTYEALNQFVRHRDGHLRAKHYRAMAEICTQINEIKRNYSQYYGEFVLVTFLGLIRSVAMFYEIFGGMFFTKAIAFNRLFSFAVLAQLFLVNAVAPIVDIFLMCTMAEFVITEADHFRWTVLLSALKLDREQQAQQAVDMILVQASCQDLRWVAATGHAVGMKTCFDLILEVVSWTLVLLLYSGNRPAAALAVLITKEQKTALILVASGLLGIVCFKKCISCFKNKNGKRTKKINLTRPLSTL